jgi:ATP adenylyltransferase/5',5'''-P-1,P-4-tetraphosphate phosphorylase II
VFFNPIRALRPPRMSGLKFESLLRPFDPSGFHFNRAFLAREIFWEGELAGKPARILYNKFPFAQLHGLLVPEPARQSPQYLTPELHAWAWDICVLSDLPGLCLGYNSYGAGASVNHLHFQSFVQPRPLPVQDPRFVHNGGTQPYPLLCQRYADAESAWLQIDQLHQSNTPYNLVYSQAGLHLIPRVPQDSKQLTAACNGYGWSEMAGAVTLFSREAFEHLDAETFEAELAQFALPG